MKSQLEVTVLFLLVRIQFIFELKKKSLSFQLSEYWKLPKGFNLRLSRHINGFLKLEPKKNHVLTAWHVLFSLGSSQWACQYNNININAKVVESRYLLYFERLTLKDDSSCFMTCINELTHKSDKHLISPYNIPPESHIKVTRVHKTIII